MKPSQSLNLGVVLGTRSPSVSELIVSSLPQPLCSEHSPSTKPLCSLLAQLGLSSSEMAYLCLSRSLSQATDSFDSTFLPVAPLLTLYLFPSPGA